MSKIVKINNGLIYNSDTGLVFRKGKVAGWKASPKPYIKTLVNGKTVSIHNLVWESLYGKIPDGFVIDHINGFPDDNRIINLRVVPVAENYKNKSKPKQNTSGHIGVSFHKASQKWRARISKNKKEWHLGLFDTKQDAILAWNSAKVKLGYHKNHGRDSIYV